MNDAEASLSGKLVWYASAAVGPISAAAAQFLLSLTLLARLPVADFGRLSFLIVVSQFSVGLWSALFTAPLLVLATRIAGNESAGEGDLRELDGLTAASFAALLPAAAAFAALAGGVGLAILPAALFALYAALVLLRQFARAWALAHGRYRLSMLSDIVYSAMLLAGIGLLALAPRAGLLMAMALLSVAILAGLAVFAAAALPGPLRLPRWRELHRYRSVWSRDSRWSLLGVVTTEMTVNSHSYLVTGLFGPAAYAPIAATALFIRPVTVAVNALVEFERARCARRLTQRALPAVRSARRHLRLMLMAVWIATLALAAAILLLAPARWMVGKFGAGVVLLGAVLWFLVVLARALHAPEGVILQAAGRFRQLALISVATAAISAVAVGVAAFVAGPVWSICGIVVGEGCFALALWRAASRYLDGAARGSG